MQQKFHRCSYGWIQKFMSTLRITAANEPLKRKKGKPVCDCTRLGQSMFLVSLFDYFVDVAPGKLMMTLPCWEEFNHDSSEPLFATWVQCFSTAGCRAPRHSDSRDIYWLYSKYAWPWSIPLRALFLSKIPPISNFLATSEHIASHPAIITKLNENKT